MSQDRDPKDDAATKPNHPVAPKGAPGPFPGGKGAGAKDPALDRTWELPRGQPIPGMPQAKPEELASTTLDPPPTPPPRPSEPSVPPQSESKPERVPGPPAGGRLAPEDLFGDLDEPEPENPCEQTHLLPPGAEPPDAKAPSVPPGGFGPGGASVPPGGEGGFGVGGGDKPPGGGFGVGGGDKPPGGGGFGSKPPGPASVPPDKGSVPPGPASVAPDKGSVPPGGGSIPPQQPSQAPPPMAAAGEPPKKKSKAVLIFVVLIILFVFVGGGVGAVFVWLSMDDGTEVAATDAGVPDAAAVVAAAQAALRDAGYPIQPTVPTIPAVPAVPDAAAVMAAAADAMAAVPDAGVAAEQPEAGAAEEPLPDAAPAAAETGPAAEPPPAEAGPAAEPEQPEPEQPEQPEQPTPAGADAALAGARDQVINCTRREQGYHPRALTVQLAVSADGSVQLRRITPPTPARVQRCIAYTLRDIRVSAPAGSISHTYQIR